MSVTLRAYHESRTERKTFERRFLGDLGELLAPSPSEESNIYAQDEIHTETRLLIRIIKFLNCFHSTNHIRSRHVSDAVKFIKVRLSWNS